MGVEYLYYRYHPLYITDIRNPDLHLQPEEKSKFRTTTDQFKASLFHGHLTRAPHSVDIDYRSGRRGVGTRAIEFEGAREHGGGQTEYRPYVAPYQPAA